MPRLKCLCGEVIQYGEIPSPNEWLLIEDIVFDKFSGRVDAEEIYKSSTSLLKCSVCSRLYIFWKGFSMNPEIFIPENLQGRNI